jgi:hypothetical protein
MWCGVRALPPALAQLLPAAVGLGLAGGLPQGSPLACTWPQPLMAWPPLTLLPPHALGRPALGPPAQGALPQASALA